MKTGKIIVVALVSFLFTAINGICNDSLIVQENGNVGIGTLQPAATLEVETQDSVENTISLLVDQKDPDQWAQEIGSNGSGLAVGLRTGSSGIPFQVTHSDAGTLLRVTSSGNMGIGTAAPVGKVDAKVDTNGQNAFYGRNADESVRYSVTMHANSVVSEMGGAYPIMMNTNGPSYIGYRLGIGTTSTSYELDVNGTIRGDNVTPSDARWKTNVTTLENSLDKVSELRGVRYEWIDHSKGTGDHIGFIAQEVEAVFPEAVSTDNQGYKSVSYAKLVSPLVEAVKTLKTENDRLKQDNDAIRQELAEIKAMLKGLQ